MKIDNGLNQIAGENRKQSSEEVDGARPEQVSADTVAACVRGDRAAQRKMYDVCHRRIYALMVRMVGSQDATDLTQQAFLQAFRKIGQFSGRSRIETWLYRVAVNEALQHLRRNRGKQVSPLEFDPTDERARHVVDSEQKDLLEQALARLDPQLRSLFLLRELEGFSYSELAQALSISEGTVGSRLNRARRELRHYLTRLGWEG